MDGYQFLQEKGTDISTIVLENAKQHQSILDAYKSTIVAMAAAINDRDYQPWTSEHSEFVINAHRSTIKAMAATIDAMDSYPYTSVHGE